jgi:hypothetical protein
MHPILNKSNLLGGSLFGWVSLGFYRGVQEYNYYRKDTPHLYSEQFGRGLLGSFIYINPFLGLFMFQKEIYRFEVNVRSLETEKKTDYYRRVM